MVDRIHSDQTRLSKSPLFFIASVGFGCYLGWGMLGSSPSLLSPVIAQTVSRTAIGDGAERIVWVLAIAILGLWAFAKRRANFSRKPISVAAGIFTAGGTIAIYATSASGTESILALSLSQLPIALSSLYILLWGEQLCLLNGKQALQCVLIASFISFAMVVFCSALPPAAQAAAQIAAPVFSSAALLCLEAKRPDREPELIFENAPKFPLRAFVGIGLFGVIVVLLQSFSEGKTDQPNELLWVIAGLIVNAALFFATIASPKEIKASFLSKLVLPLLVISAFFVFATDFGQQNVEVLAIGCSWIYLRLFTWIIWRIGALSSNVPPMSVIAIGQLILTAGTIAGGTIYVAMIDSGASQLMIIAFICILGILVAMFFLDTRYVAELADGPVPFDPEDRAICERCVDNATAKYGLSGQERAIALMLVRGDDNDSIQNELVIATNTLRTHLRNMYKKTDAHSREDLVLLLRSLTHHK